MSDAQKDVFCGIKFIAQKKYTVYIIDVTGGGVRMEEKAKEKALLNVKEFCEYLGIGQTKARELLNDPANGFTVRIGNRLYAHRGKLDMWLLNHIL